MKLEAVQPAPSFPVMLGEELAASSDTGQGGGGGQTPREQRDTPRATQQVSGRAGTSTRRRPAATRRGRSTARGCAL